MIDFFLGLLAESPVLFAVLLVNIIIVIYILAEIFLYFYKKKQPGRVLSFFIWKLKTVRAGKDDVKTVGDAYRIIMDSLRKEGILTNRDGYGYNARKKALGRIPEEKRELLSSLFSYYEAGIYGERGVKNEADIAANFISGYFGN